LIGFACCAELELAVVKAFLRVAASLLVQSAMISTIAPASQMVGRLSRFSILEVFMAALAIQRHFLSRDALQRYGGPFKGRPAMAPC
jgi:hypothetical protein